MYFSLDLDAGSLASMVFTTPGAPTSRMFRSNVIPDAKALENLLVNSFMGEIQSEAAIQEQEPRHIT